jgi:Family of unknown function (DUF5995)
LPPLCGGEVYGAHAPARDRASFAHGRGAVAVAVLVAAVLFAAPASAEELANGRYARGEPVDPAWQIAFDTAKSSDVNAAQDMLLGINAHVQNDMPFVLAALGQRTRSRASRKPDHDKMNEILDAAYERVVRQIEDRFDPIATTNARWTFADDYAGLEMVKEWREQVWRNAERLLAATTDAERAEVADQIHPYAAGCAQMIANPIQVPGYRAQRDAYCKTAAQSQR